MERFKLFRVESDAGCQADTAQTVDSRNGPAALLKAYDALLGNFNVPRNFKDMGALSTGDSVTDLLLGVHSCVLENLAKKQPFILLGGAHTLTLGALRALKEKVSDYSLVYFDAHPDLMPDEEVHYGSTLFHAIEENRLNPQRLLYVAIRAIEQEEQELIDKHGIAVVTVDELRRTPSHEIYARYAKQLPGPYYLSIDLDAIDPAFAPGVSTPYPLGADPRDVVALAKQYCGKDLLGFEIVELAPAKDLSNGLTARMAAALLQELTV